MKVMVVGLGLIGGSILKALKGTGYEVYGYDINDEVLDTCFEQGLIVSKLAILTEMDIVMVCLYPDAAIEYINMNQDSFKSGAIITDVAGLKVSVMSQLRLERDDITFIGGHPMAGKEGCGFEASSKDIFINANYLLVHEQANDVQVEILKDLIYTLNCGHIQVLDAESHDEIIAYTSHMPHILSTTFMTCDRFEETRHCIAGSFRDMTRVSDINAELWTELILENKMPVLDEIKRFKKALDAFEQYIVEEDNYAVTKFLGQARLKKRAL